MLNRQYDYFLDLSGLSCPLPILKAKKQLAALSANQVLLLKCTDPNTLADFQAFDKMTTHDLLEYWQEESNYFFLLKK